MEKTIGMRIRECRIKLGMTQQDLAEVFNAPPTISGYYQAEVNHDMPQYAIRQKII